MKQNKILVIDNNDPSTGDLVQSFIELEADIEVYKNDNIKINQIAKMSPDRIVISPGPGLPANAGVTKEIIEFYSEKIPILGICLGHHAIGEIYGAKVVKANELMLSRNSQIHHDHSLLFKGMYSSFWASQCSSFILEKETIPENIRISAWNEDGAVMSIQVIDTLTFGIQFRPESPSTPKGLSILKNFLRCKY